MFYDREWNAQDFYYKRKDAKGMARPENLDELIEVAEKLASGLPFARIDFHRLDSGKLYFGEITFTPQQWLFSLATRECGYDAGFVAEASRQVSLLLKRLKIVRL